LPDAKIDITDLIGKPFDLNGTGDTGWNCYNLCCEVCRRAGVEIPERQPIEDLSERSVAIEQGLCEHFINIEKPEPYCLVTFKVRPPYVTHVGVVLEDCRTFIHVMAKRNVVVERLDNLNWIKKIDGYYRYVRTPNN